MSMAMADIKRAWMLRKLGLPANTTMSDADLIQQIYQDIDEPLPGGTDSDAPPAQFVNGRLWGGRKMPSSAVNPITTPGRAYAGAYWFDKPCTILEISLGGITNSAAGNIFDILAFGKANEIFGLPSVSIHSLDVGTAGVKTAVLATPYPITSKGFWNFGVKCSVGSSRYPSVVCDDVQPYPNPIGFNDSGYAESNHVIGAVWNSLTPAPAPAFAFKLGGIT